MKENKKYKSIPATENGSMVTNITSSGDVYLITQNLERLRFTLWKKVNDGFEKIETGANPLELEIPW